MTGWTSSLLGELVVGVILFAVLLAIIVRLALSVAERYERQQAMKRRTHPAGKHTEAYVHGGQR